MSATLEWMQENPDKCAACGGVGAEYVPGEGFLKSACPVCEGDGLSDEFREMGWKHESEATTIGFALPSPLTTQGKTKTEE